MSLTCLLFNVYLLLTSETMNDDFFYQRIPLIFNISKLVRKRVSAFQRVRILFIRIIRLKNLDK